MVRPFAEFFDIGDAVLEADGVLHETFSIIRTDVHGLLLIVVIVYCKRLLLVVQSDQTIKTFKDDNPICDDIE
jgi:hypothetical protein